MARRPNILTVLAALTLLCGAAGPADARVLHVYTALDTFENQDYFDAFEAATSIRVRFVPLSAGEILTRIRSERRNPQASVWYGGPSLDFMVGAREGLLVPFQPTGPEAGFVPHGRDWRFWGFYRGLVGFASNPHVLARRGLEPPTSWAELLKARLRGELGMAYPYTSGTSYTVLASLVQMMGEDRALRYLQRLDRNVHHYNRSGGACVTQVGLGEIGTCIAFSNDVLRRGTRRGYPVVLTFPTEGTGYELGCMGLIRGGPEQEEGRRLMQWSVSRQAQSLLARWFRIPVRNDVPLADGVPALDSVRLIDLDPERAGRDRARLIEAWRELTGL